ncbi:hypothetical protein OAG19_00490 [Akkermansiaceae bacterium]|nr:hypothetical protein [Akkermansiaceae bacterium]
MSFRYDSRIIGPNGYKELMIAVLNQEDNPIDSCCHKLDSPDIYDIESAETGAHNFGIEGWELDPADQYQGYAIKQIGS